MGGKGRKLYLKNNLKKVKKNLQQNKKGYVKKKTKVKKMEDCWKTRHPGSVYGKRWRLREISKHDLGKNIPRWNINKE